MTRIVISYHCSKLFLTLDLQTLFRSVFETFGNDLEVVIRPMADWEVKASESEVGGVSVVNSRFMIYDASGQRLVPLEEEIVNSGRK
jgi:hypothetical protein